ncbi:hypothetical protein Daus18300_011264 [Diaporthe australafricana]|uniref:Uncharacterized protein n=1 Tax=Diaporthe australafricana TaxID=127596 RepID=A0ABR3W7L1_9PEZI
MTTPLANGYAIGGPVGVTTQDLLDHVTGALIRYSQNQPDGPNWPLGPTALKQMGVQLPTPEVPNNTQVTPVDDRISFETIALNGAETYPMTKRLFFEPSGVVPSREA